MSHIDIVIVVILVFPYSLRSRAKMDLPYLLHLQRKLHVSRSTLPIGSLPTDLLHTIIAFLTPLPYLCPTFVTASAASFLSTTSTASSLPLLLSLRVVCRSLALQLQPLLLRLYPRLHVAVAAAQIDRIDCLPRSPAPIPSLTLNAGLLRQQHQSLFTSALPSFTHLRRLHLIRCPSILPPLLALLPGLPLLRALTLDRMALLNLSAPLPRLPALLDFSLGLVHDGCSAATLNALLRCMPALRSLTLFSCQRPGTETPPLFDPRAAPQLRALTVRGFSLRLTSVACVHPLPLLTSLALESCTLTPAFLAALPTLTLPSLQSLSFASSALRPAGSVPAALAFATAMHGRPGLRTVDLTNVDGQDSAAMPRAPEHTTEGCAEDERAQRAVPGAIDTHSRVA